MSFSWLTKFNNLIFNNPFCWGTWFLFRMTQDSLYPQDSFLTLRMETLYKLKVFIKNICWDIVNFIKKFRYKLVGLNIFIDSFLENLKIPKAIFTLFWGRKYSIFSSYLIEFSWTDKVWRCFGFITKNIKKSIFHSWYPKSWFDH